MPHLLTDFSYSQIDVTGALPLCHVLFLNPFSLPLSDSIACEQISLTKQLWQKKDHMMVARDTFQDILFLHI